jgi:hypothetical protein
MLSLLFTPLARYTAIAAVLLLTLSGVYYKVRRDAVAALEAAATADVLRRTRDAIGASDALDLSPDRVRDADPNRRD